ncbi:MAG TPA: YitT family protein [Candidatus Onthousia excrementipullorum]|uniref:YitT family protein n=1 Tax=Candidatus Onthousia excrementipullorum TaxID=2840884 RepID=A0A9D1DVA2_9FIRM|nr:YitT family protein [Candidatus Onthousia excrementipullorum]
MKEAIKHKIKIKELIEFIIGCFLVALAFNLFMSPNNLVAGGVSGFSLILKHFFGLNPSTIISIANVFLIILSFLVLGKEKTKATILGSILFPVFVSLTEHLSTYISFKESEMILIAVFGGALQGLGAGLIFRAGYSTGGTDILNMIISKVFKMSLGNSMFFTDGTIIVIGAFVFGFNHLMYSLIILYLISTITDKVVLGISDSKAFYIITSKEKEVKDFVINELKHGVTEFKARGGYNSENQTVLMSVVPTREYYKLKEGIHNIDKDAFFVAMDSYEVKGGA